MTELRKLSDVNAEAINLCGYMRAEKTGIACPMCKQELYEYVFPPEAQYHAPTGEAQLNCLACRFHGTRTLTSDDYLARVKIWEEHQAKSEPKK